MRKLFLLVGVFCGLCFCNVYSESYGNSDVSASGAASAGAAGAASAGAAGVMLDYSDFVDASELRKYSGALEYLRSPAAAGANVPLEDVLARFKDVRFKLAIQWMVFAGKLRNVAYTFEDITRFYLYYGHIAGTSNILKNIENRVYRGKVGFAEAISFYVAIRDKRVIRFAKAHGIHEDRVLEYVARHGGDAYLGTVLEFKVREIDELFAKGKVDAALKVAHSQPNKTLRLASYARAFCATSKREYLSQLGLRKVDASMVGGYIGFAADCAKYFLKHKKYSSALGLAQRVSTLPEGMNSHFWNNVYVRSILELVKQEKYFEVYRVLDENIFPYKSYQYLENEFWAGFISLRYTGQYKSARKHFQALYSAAGDGDMHHWSSKAAYYLHLANIRSGRYAEAKKFLRESSRYLKTFYGQVAMDKLNGIEPVNLMGLDHYTAEEITANVVRRNAIYSLYFNEIADLQYPRDKKTLRRVASSLKHNHMVGVGFIFAANGQYREATEFITHVLKRQPNGPAAYLILEALKRKQGNEKIVRKVYRFVNDSGGLVVDAYSVLPFVVQDFSREGAALLHSIMKAESNFNHTIESHAGAVGIMQLMPFTARSISKSMKLKYSRARLREPSYNVRLGTFYIAKMMKMFNYSHPFAVASYNAGPGNVRKWQRQFGDINSVDDLLDFVELIPYRETRLYVKRVLEEQVVYQYLLHVRAMRRARPVVESRLRKA